MLWGRDLSRAVRTAPSRYDGTCWCPRADQPPPLVSHFRHLSERNYPDLVPSRLLASTSGYRAEIGGRSRGSVSRSTMDYTTLSKHYRRLPKRRVRLPYRSLRQAVRGRDSRARAHRCVFDASRVAIARRYDLLQETLVSGPDGGRLPPGDHRDGRSANRRWRWQQLESVVVA